MATPIQASAAAIVISNKTPITSPAMGGKSSATKNPRVAQRDKLKQTKASGKPV